MHETLQTNAESPRGTQLLEEFLDVVPELAKLGPEDEPLAWATINLFASIGSVCWITSTSTTTSSASTSCGD